MNSISMRPMIVILWQCWEALPYGAYITYTTDEIDSLAPVKRASALLSMAINERRFGSEDEARAWCEACAKSDEIKIVAEYVLSLRSPA